MTFRRLLPLVPVLDLAALVAFSLNPIRDTPIRSAIILTALLLLPLALAACWKHRLTRRILLAFSLLLLLLLVAVALLPGRPVPAAELQSAYLDSLRSYESSPYVWGGETHRGIDCSGLPRKAWMHANLWVALAHCNAGLFREAAYLWWNDSSARNFTTTYNGRLLPITQRPANLALLRAGDVAITPDGSHALVYLGAGQWIQADPILLKVQSSPLPEQYLQSMTIMRWLPLSQ